MRTLLICALAATQVGCSSQPPTQPSCLGLNPLACLTAVDVPIEPVASDSSSARAKVSTAAWRDDAPPRTADQAIRRTATPKPVRVAARATPAVPMPAPSPRARQQTVGMAPATSTRVANATDPPPAKEAGQVKTTEQQVAAASAAAEGMSLPTLDASLDTLVAILLTGPDIRSVDELSGKTIAIDDRYSDSSIRGVRSAMVAAGALDVQISKGQSTAISRLVDKEVPAAVVGLVSVSAADSFPELSRLKTFRVPLSPRSARKQ